ncbi:hypothetical protein GGR50DRAFT_98398 [Xylaria sp. CBS 124048]|nr:hypothetical protein GGR50DRAFT_98398 [Xylaria sp. CBS 124048]
MVRFVESDTTGLPLKRKQVAHACDRCRRRKKRCVHADPKAHVDSPPVASTKKATGPRRSPVSPSIRSGGRPRISNSTSTATSFPPTGNTQLVSVGLPNGDERRDTHASTFLGDLNPEAILMEATSLCSRRDVSAPGGLGIWQAPIPPRSNLQSLSVPSVPSYSRQAVRDMLRSYIWNHCLPCRPPAPDYEVLKRMYFEKMNPIFPILDDPSAHTNSLDEPTEILVQQIISLAAAADPDATQHLRVSPHGPLLSRQEFCACLSNAVLTTLDAGVVTDRVWLMRLSAALSLYTQPTNVEEADIPALLNSRAVHQMHTLGVHMAVDHAHPKRDMIRTIFCCLWALDRITSAFYGRACMIHERDVGWDLHDCIRAQAPPLHLLLLIINLLDQVIALYRPGTRQNAPAHIQLPIFEQLVMDAGASRLPNSCLASLEIFYHSVAILSSQSPADITSSALPNPATNSRRSLAADRITSIIGEEFAGQLCYMPFIPYGLSLSLSVSYRKMRHSKVPMFRNRGKRAFRKSTLLLKSMDDMFWKSKTMVAMAEQVLNEMDKTVASLAQENGLTMSDVANKRAVVEPESPQVQPEEIRLPDFTAAAQNSTERDTTEYALLDTIPDLDVFGHFDPGFDLDAVDAALEGNLEFGNSTNWFDWQRMIPDNLRYPQT